jgi:cobalt-zinc-cadmium efflux system membrane fusion protein
MGAAVTVHAEGAGDVEGRITWISAEVDPRTRTVSARAELPNPDGRLRANQFVRATVRVAGFDGAVEVPRDALQRLGTDTVVFVRTGEGEYEPRLVSVSRTAGDVVHVNGEIDAGEPVVVEGAYLLKTELSRDAIGAGCCEVGTKTAER